jgi:hypothetical protein
VERLAPYLVTFLLDDLFHMEVSLPMIVARWLHSTPRSRPGGGQLRDLCRTTALLFATLLFAAESTRCSAQVTVVNDDFEQGRFSADWDSTSGAGTAVIHAPGDATGGSDYFARVDGVTGSQGGLGVTLMALAGQDSAASDFSVALDFRIDPVQANRRMFNLMVNTGSADPTPSNSAVNLRYWNDTWQAYDGAWQSLRLPPISAGDWHSLTLSGSNWGTGVPGTAAWEVVLDGESPLAGLQLFQNDADASGARSVSLNDRWDGTGFDVDNVTITATPGAMPASTVVMTPTQSVAYSGIYPHLAVTNSHNEVGVGGLVSRQGKIYFNTYGPHITTGGSDKFYRLDTSDLSLTTYLNYPGGTHANRYSDSHLGIDVIGAAYLDAADEVRFLPIGPYPSALEGRITGTAAHLTDAHKLYYMTMEEGLYEVDFTHLDTPLVNELKPDRNNNHSAGDYDLPGVHGKGLYTGQGRLYYTNNGNEGVLAEWDGVGDPSQQGSWTIVDVNNYTEVTSRRGPKDMTAGATDPIWATGWDDRSVLLNVRDAASGQWTKFRLPKSSYTHDASPGWYTEWPRIRDVGLAGGHLLSHHGMMFLVPEDFSASHYGGLTPLAVHHKMIVDYVENGDQVVFAANDASRFSNALVPRPNSNLMLLDKSEVRRYGGNPSGYGGVWVDEEVVADTPSEPFLIAGFEDRVLHLTHDQTGSVQFTLEIDSEGTGQWETHQVVNVAGNSGGRGGYAPYLLPPSLPASWMRVTSDTTATATAYLHLANGFREADIPLMRSLARSAAPAPRSQGLLRSRGENDFKLEFAADILDAQGDITGRGYYQARLNPSTLGLDLIAVDDPAADSAVRSGAATTQDFQVDAASVYVDQAGTRFRLPKGNSIFDTPTASGPRRGIREVVTERAVANIHGTIYEVPRENSGGFRRIRPITTHNRDLFDFASWRGMLVISGNELAAAPDEHLVRSDDGRVGLWFGNVDDLWRFGPPEGVGGPWKDSLVTAGKPSDPYLMTGYRHKTLQLSHAAPSAVDFTIQVDFLGTDQWHELGRLTVDSGEVLTYEFATGFQAHWVRLIANTDTTATAWLTYRADDSPPPGDINQDGAVDGADFLQWQREFGTRGESGMLPGDVNGDGAVDHADLDLWQTTWGTMMAGTAQSQSLAVPESITTATGALALLAGRCRPPSRGGWGW